MASVLSDHIPMRVVKTVSGNAAQCRGIAEKASSTFLSGVPVMLTTSGALAVIQEWNATVTEPATATAGIAGITSQPGSNLGSDGAGQPGVFTPVGAPAAAPTFGKVQGQSAAVNFTPGTPMVDGRNIFEVANEDTIFEGQFDDNGGSTTNATTAFNMIGKHFGLTKDVTGHWFVDFAKVTQGTNTVVTIVALNPNDGAILNGRVWFKFEIGIQQLGN
jgi:hypothetical protein